MFIGTKIEYKVSKEFAETNRKNLSAFLLELESIHQDAIRYRVFVQDDGQSFVHLFVHPDTGPALFSNLATFQKFETELKASNPLVGPTTLKLTPVTSSGVLTKLAGTSN